MHELSEDQVAPVVTGIGSVSMGGCQVQVAAFWPLPKVFDNMRTASGFHDTSLTEVPLSVLAVRRWVVEPALVASFSIFTVRSDVVVDPFVVVVSRCL